MPRLDAELVARGIAASREKGKGYIKDGKILVNGKVETKPSAEVAESDIIVYTGEAEKYVGRGGLKLEKAISYFNIDLSGLVCLDLGASTGGFTDCMLQNGALKVFAVDVGHGQLADKLVNDSRVVNIEGVNVKDFTLDLIGMHPDFVCADLSFISVKYAAQAAFQALDCGGKAVFLIKPQFEAGKSALSKGGIVKDKKIHVGILSSVTDAFCQIGFSVCGLTYSPIRGGDGNVEYLAYAVKENTITKKSFDYNAIVSDGFADK